MTQPWSNEEHDAIRSLFPGTGRGPYLDVANRGLISTPVRDAARHYVDDRLYGGADKAVLWANVDSARRRYAGLIHAEADEIAIVKNVSEGLNLFANSLPWKAGDNVVVCPDLEHPNNVFLWYNLRDRIGIEVRELASDGGHFPLGALDDAIDGNTRLVTVPAISFAPGFVTDVKTVTDLAHRHDALVLVDGAQSVGGMRTHVYELGVDALAVATQKCLLSLYGLGFLYVRRQVAEELRPASVGRYGVDLGEGAHETSLSDGPLTFQPGARRFDLSNHNYLGAAATDASLELIHELGVDRIEAHVRGLAARLADGMAEQGWPVFGGASGPHLNHIVCVGHGGGRHYGTDDPAINGLYEHFTEGGAKLSIRAGTLRFSIAVYNNEADIDQILAWSSEREPGRLAPPAA